jgi:hypothetical protein
MSNQSTVKNLLTDVTNKINDKVNKKQCKSLMK